MVNILPSQKKFLGYIPGREAFLHLVSVWVLTSFSIFLPQTKDMHVSVTGDLKLLVDMNVSV